MLAWGPVMCCQHLLQQSQFGREGDQLVSIHYLFSKSYEIFKVFMKCLQISNLLQDLSMIDF